MELGTTTVSVKLALAVPAVAVTVAGKTLWPTTGMVGNRV
jgi:hypothetical protein